jgi:ribonuclease BN (tRNA processing enzyme)
VIPLLLSCAPAAPEPTPPELVPAPAPEAHETRLAVLGSGTPVPDPDRGGQALAVVARGRALLFDAGPGVLRRAQAAAEAHREDALLPHRLDTVFLTHLHSDHTLGLPELLLGAWVVGREQPLRVFGPPGTRDMVASIREAWAEDRRIRTDGAEGLDPAAVRAEVTEWTGGERLVEQGFTVQAVPVAHGTWEHALGYRIVGPDGRVIVISGDTVPTDAVVEACDGCSLLVHEVYSAQGFGAVPSEGFRRYHGTFHTSTTELAELAGRARPDVLLLNHVLFFGTSPETLLGEVRAGWDGRVELATDLEVY